MHMPCAKSVPRSQPCIIPWVPMHNACNCHGTENATPTAMDVWLCAAPHYAGSLNPDIHLSCDVLCMRDKIQHRWYDNTLAQNTTRSQKALETIVSPQMTTGYPSTGISNINKLLGFRKHSPAAHTRCHTMQCKSIPDH
mmetsp:Transcript_82740/g.138062  ORF Transcript_82740/g.138062 Transcript_82740/m.138062 type:complete len:139 (+) Transcript_82740:395-811(+)